MWLERLEFFLGAGMQEGSAKSRSQHPLTSPFPGSAGSWSEPCLGVFMQWMAQGDAVVADPAGTLVCYFLWSSGEDLPPVSETFFAMK